MGTLQEHLKDTIEYTQKLLSLGERVVFDVLTESVAAFQEQEFHDRDGILLDPDGGENWIRIRRLQETQAPPPGEDYSEWYDANLKSPDKPPVLRDTRMVKLDGKTIELWLAKGILDAEDVMEPLHRNTSGKKDVILRAERLPNFQNKWDAYLNGPWSEWAAVEKPRRKIIALYNKLYQIHQRMVSFGEDNPLELVMGVGVALWRVNGRKVTSTLIEQGVETEIDEDGSFLVRPRSVVPIVNLKPFHALEIVTASEAVQRQATAELARLIESSTVSFSPFDKETFAPVLRLCANNLTPTGRYLPDDGCESRSLPALEEHLAVTDTWLLFARQRTEDVRRDDLKRLQDKVIDIYDEEQLPPAARGFVRRPSTEQKHTFDVESNDLDLPDGPSVVRPGTRVASNPAEVKLKDRRGSEEVFFPLPFNKEQIEIAGSLQDKDAPGIVVQGPPGTGKTHTIANVICHYLAGGKNVLVTAKTPEALIAIQEKLPEGIRKLAISIVHDDRDGARQLEAAMTLLSEEAKQVRVPQIKEEIQTKQHRLREIRNRLEQIDSEIGAIARRNLEKVRYRGSDLVPMDLAETVVRERHEHTWFPDQLAVSADPLFDEPDVSIGRKIREQVKDDLRHPTECIPAFDVLLSIAEVVKAHQTLSSAATAEEAVDRGDVPMLVVEKPSDLEAARALDLFFENLAGFAGAMGERGEWLKRIVLTGARLQATGGAGADALLTLLAQWGDLARRGRPYLRSQVDVGAATPDQHDLDLPLENLASGKRPFGVVAIGKAELKRRLDSTSINGQKPQSPAEWKAVREFRLWHSEVDAFIADWNAMASTHRVVQLDGSWSRPQAARFIISWGDHVERAGVIIPRLNPQIQVAKRLFPYGIDFDSVFLTWNSEQLKRALAANFVRIGARDAKRAKVSIQNLGSAAKAPFNQAVGDAVDSIGNPKVSDHVVAQSWQQVLAHAERLNGFRSELARLDDLAEKISRSGAPKWARMVRSLPNSDFEVLPASWRRTWEWASADAFVRSICDRQRLTMLRTEQSKLDVEQKRLFEEVIRLRTFLGLKTKITDAVEAALARFAAAISRLGAGTGKAAPRYRRIIRNATADAADAIPCWIMPEWRISEQLPSRLGMFDLVIVDEASQSNITALPAILRGKKVLIVGDDKQVSPTVVGIGERQIIQLRETYLKGHPLRDQLEPSTSLYDLAKIAFPGKVIMLREHFRCVEPIIRFSSQFYSGKLVPLRLPTATERLDPPLVDILVRGARRVREVNEAEANVVIDEIRKLTEDPQYGSRSIGVISLVGEKQAKFIHDRLVTDIGVVAMKKHRIMCGNAATFQGQERDIIFLSMVECPETARAKASRVFEQRFNVALSRARDRMILVRSVTLADLKSEADLKRKVIEHFQDPMKTGKIATTKDALEACQSDFEREVGTELISRGYRLRAQVPVGQYSLDFVVEGEGDLRLAVECDGDQYHRSDRWAADLQRQRSLERAGWTFWRIWGSHWRADREGCIFELLDTLRRLGIKPLGAEKANHHWTEYREVGEESAEIGPPPQSKSDTVTEVAGQEASSRSIIFQEAVADGTKAEAAISAEAKAVAGVDKIRFFGTPSVPTSKEAGVEIGDWVTVRYVDNNRVRKLQISEDLNEPDNGVIWVRSPLGAALLNTRIDDEVEYELKPGEHRTVVVQAIEPARNNV